MSQRNISKDGFVCYLRLYEKFATSMVKAVFDFHEGKEGLSLLVERNLNEKDKILSGIFGSGPDEILT
jgi:hypothetical protein